MTTTATKNPKNVVRGKKTYETHLKKIKEGILSSTTNSGDLTPVATTTSTPLTTTATSTSTTIIPTSTPSFTTSFSLLGTCAIAVIIFAAYFYINRNSAPTTINQNKRNQKRTLHFSICNKEPHTAIFSGLTGCGKTHRILDLLENEYKGHFEYVVILCPTLRYNKTYLARSWIKEDDRVFLVESGGKLLEWLKLLSAFFSGKNVLFIVDDMISDERLDKTRGALLDIAISGRHREHSMWMLTQRYKKVPITVRDQLKQLFVWFPKDRHELELIQCAKRSIITSIPNQYFFAEYQKY